MIASVVLAVAVIAVSASLSASYSQSSVLQVDHYTVSLARQLMEEIAAKPLVAVDATPGWPTQTDRSAYDTVNDYSGYTDGSPLPTLEGTAATPSANTPFTRTVTFEYPATLFATVPAIGEMVIVHVTARDASGRSCTLSRLVTRANVKR